MTVKDVTVSGNVGANQRNGVQSGYIVQKNNTDLYYFSIYNNTIWWQVSYDNGLSWGHPQEIKASATITNYSVWFDKWTPGNTGNLIHLAYIESGADDVLYRNLDVNTETLGTETTIATITSTSTPTNACVAITCAIGGNLYCLYDVDGGTETGFYRSTDTGGTWASRTNTAEGGDYFLLAPGFAADTQDILCIFWDRSANEISRKIYDDSANSWAETSIATSMTAVATTTCTPEFALTVDDANNKILLVAWTNRDTANADLRFWSIDETTITEGTNVVLNSVDDQQMCALALDATLSKIWCFYGGKSDGSETAGTSINIYYKISSDGGSTWGSETKLSNFPRNYDALFTSILFVGNPAVVYCASTSSMLLVRNAVILPQVRVDSMLGLG